MFTFAAIAIILQYNTWWEIPTLETKLKLGCECWNECGERNLIKCNLLCTAAAEREKRERDGQRGIVVIMWLCDVAVCVCVCEAAVSSHTHACGSP